MHKRTQVSVEHAQPAEPPTIAEDNQKEAKQEPFEAVQTETPATLEIKIPENTEKESANDELGETAGVVQHNSVDPERIDKVDQEIHCNTDQEIQKDAEQKTENHNNILIQRLRHEQMVEEVDTPAKPIEQKLNAEDSQQSNSAASSDTRKPQENNMEVEKVNLIPSGNKANSLSQKMCTYFV